MKKPAQSAEEKARLAALLKEKAEKYITKMEDAESSINFDRIPSDNLIIVEAFNEWSAGALGEGGSVHFTHSGDDPTCATGYELNELLTRTHVMTTLLYPVSGFVLSDEGERLCLRILEASYQLLPHSDGSRTSAVNVARAKHISGVDACHQLWLLCATEDCIAYLWYQMDLHRLQLTTEDLATTRRIISGFLQDKLSPGQVWNAIWRTVKHAAAMSTRQYYNSTKAAALVPKHLDKILTQALGDTSFEAYDRILATPVGAVLMRFRQKFGVDDTTPGSQVREALAADALLAPPQGKDADQTDEEEVTASGSATQGTLYFSRAGTDLDKMALTFFEGVEMETVTPVWLPAKAMGRIDFTAMDTYCFNGPAFFQAVIELLNIELPAYDEAAEHALPTSKDRLEHDLAYRRLVAEVLIGRGFTPLSAKEMSRAMRYWIEPKDLVTMLQGFPLSSGLSGVRFTHTSIDGSYGMRDDVLAAGILTFEFNEEYFMPQGDDLDVVASMQARDMDAVADIVTNAVARCIQCKDNLSRALFLEGVGQKLLEMAQGLKAEEPQ